MQGKLGLLSRFLGIFFDEVCIAFYQRVRQSRIHRLLTPGKVLLVLFYAAIAHELRRDIKQTVSTLRIFILDNIFHRVTQFCRQIIVNRQLPRIDDTHIHARLNGVI